MTGKKAHRPRVSSVHSWVILLAALIVGCGGLSVTRYFDNGAVATTAPIATAVGERVFAEGGNAFDVAVAVGFALAVVHPEAGNIGGGGFAVIRHGESGQIKALDFRETAPGVAYETMYLDSAGSVIANASTVGAGAAGVPGTVAGLYELWRTYGSLPWETLVGMAAALADTGFIVDDYFAVQLNKYRAELEAFEPSARQFFPGGRAPMAGSKFVQKDLAKTLYRIAAQGRDGFYRGEVGQLIAQTMTSYGGLITDQDLEAYVAVWREPVHFRFDSLDIYSMPPPSSGGVLIGQILKILEPYDFSKLTPSSPEYIHLFCEASRLAFADRAEHLGDPAFYDVPVERLLEDSYIGSRRGLISTEHALLSEDVGPGVFSVPEPVQTTHFSVADRDGNLVALTYTLNENFGCKLVVDGAGFLLNNEMDDFSVKPGEPNVYGLVGTEANKIEAGKRMLSSMSPTLILTGGRPVMVLGSPGGGKIITAVAQAIVHFSRFHLSPIEIVAQPRIHHQWLPDVLYLEQGGFHAEVRDRLTALGHKVEEREPYGDLQLIYINADGLMVGASDPRYRGRPGGL